MKNFKRLLLLSATCALMFAFNMIIFANDGVAEEQATVVVAEEDGQDVQVAVASSYNAIIYIDGYGFSVNYSYSDGLFAEITSVYVLNGPLLRFTFTSYASNSWATVTFDYNGEKRISLDIWGELYY